MILQHTRCAYTIPHKTIDVIRIAAPMIIILLKNSCIVSPWLEEDLMPLCGKIVNDKVVSVEFF